MGACYIDAVSRTATTPAHLSRHTVSGLVLVMALATGLGAAEIPTITHGERVDLHDHLVEGKYVLFDFYADWCGPCRALEPEINRLAARYEDQLVVRKVDIIDWKSAVAQQYRLRSIPHLKLYDGEGYLVHEGTAGAVLVTLNQRLGGGGSLPAGGSGSNAIAFLVVVLMVAAAATLLLIKGRKAEPAETTASAHAAAVTPKTVGHHEGIWLVMIRGSLEGPFTEEQLEDMRRRRCIDAGSRLRRRGDAGWRTLADVLEL
jgi:thioredoxin 1